MRGLSRERDHRHASARELRDELDAFARRAALNVSEQAMARLMTGLFARELEPWNRARATGLTLEEHVVKHTLRERPPELAPPRVPGAPSPKRRAARRARWLVRVAIVGALIALGYLAARLTIG